MGLLDRFIKAVGDATEKAVDAAFSQKNNSQKPVAPAAPVKPAAPVTPAVDMEAERFYSDDGKYEFNRNFNRDKAYFRAILDRNFPNWTIEENVPITALNASAHPKCMPITFLMSDGARKFAFFVMRDGQQNGMPYVGSCENLHDLGIRKTHCITCYKNEEAYVVNRINQAM